MRCKLVVGYSAVTCKLNMEGRLNKKRKAERGLKCNYYFESSCRLLLAVLYDLYLGRGGHEIFAIFGYFTGSCLIPTYSLLVKLWNFRIIIIEFLKKLIPTLSYVSAFQFEYNKRKIGIWESWKCRVTILGCGLGCDLLTWNFALEDLQSISYLKVSRSLQDFKIILQHNSIKLKFNYHNCLTVLVANWGLPLAAMSDMKKDPEFISGKMTTGILTLHHYSFIMYCSSYPLLNQYWTCNKIWKKGSWYV